MLSAKTFSLGAAPFSQQFNYRDGLDSPCSYPRYLEEHKILHKYYNHSEEFPSAETNR